MAYFSWSVSSGSLNAAQNWSQPDPKHPTVPGAGDYADFVGSGALFGSLTVGQSEVIGNFTLDGTLNFNQGVDVAYMSSGTFAIASGSSVTTGFLNVGHLSGSSGTVTVLGGSVHATSIGLGIQGDATLSVGEGGTVTGGNVDIAYNTTSQSSATVSGSGSLFAVGFVTIGDAGSGSLSVSDGASASMSGATLANQAGSHGSLSVTGTGTSVNMTGGFSVGYGGAGTFDLDSGAVLLADFLNIGYLAGSSGDADIAGSGTTFDTTGGGTYRNIGVGFFGTASLAIEDGATVKTNGLEVGISAGSSGGLTVDDAALTVLGFVNDGGSGSGSLSASNGATLDFGSIGVGNNAGGKSALTLDDADLTSHGYVTVGYAGSGSLSATDGATLTIASGYGLDLGWSTGASAEATVDDATISAAGAFLGVGDLGSATLAASGGATLNFGGVGIAGDFGGKGTLTLEDSDLTAAGYVNVGAGGSGSLGLADGASFTIASGYGLHIGTSAGATGKVTIDDASLSAADNFLAVGDQGSGTLAATDGATVEFGGVTVGNQLNGTGTLTLDAADLTAVGYVNIGFGGSGSLGLSAGATLTISGGFGMDLGTSAGVSGGATFDDATLSAPGTPLTVGDQGSGTVSATHGASLEVSGVTVANQAGSHGALALDDSDLTAAGSTIGAAGSGTLAASDGATLTIGGGVDIGASLGGDGTVTLDDATLSGPGANLTVGDQGSGTFSASDGATVDLNGGTVGNQAGSHGTLAIAGPDTSVHISHGLTVGNGGSGTFTLDDGATVLADFLNMGQLAASSGEGDISGSDTTFDTTGGATYQNIGVGFSGAADLTIEDGATVKTNGLEVAVSAGSSGGLTVDDATLSVSGILSVAGASGSSGSLSLGSDASVTAQRFVMGAGTSSIDITDGSVLTATSNVANVPSIIIGSTGAATMTVSGGAEVDAARALLLGSNVGGSGTLDVADGTVNATFLSVGGGLAAGGTGMIAAAADGTVAVTSLLRLFAGTLDTSGGGSIDVGVGVGAVSGAVHVGQSGLLQGAGTIDGALVDDTTVIASGGTLTVTGDVSGSGSLQIGANSTLELGGADTADVTFTVSDGTLQLDDPSNFSRTISGLAIGDRIDLAGISVEATNVADSKLTVTESGGATLLYQVAGALNGNGFDIEDDGSGGTDLVLNPWLFTDDADSVNFNALTSDQSNAIESGAELYDTLGGNDVVVLPNLANYQLTSSVAWDPSQVFHAGSGNDTITGGDGSYTIDMGSGQTSLTITGDGDSSIAAGSGADTITITGNGNNTILTVVGASAAETIAITGNGDNSFIGAAGTGPDNVTIYGTGDSTIYGGSGNDQLTALGGGSATLTGGAGNDTFDVEDGDVITDFEQANDQIFFLAPTSLDSLDQAVASSLNGVTTLTFYTQSGSQYVENSELTLDGQFDPRLFEGQHPAGSGPSILQITYGAQPHYDVLVQDLSNWANALSSKIAAAEQGLVDWAIKEGEDQILELPAEEIVHELPSALATTIEGAGLTGVLTQLIVAGEKAAIDAADHGGEINQAQLATDVAAAFASYIPGGGLIISLGNFIVGSIIDSYFNDQTQAIPNSFPTSNTFFRPYNNTGSTLQVGPGTSAPMAQLQSGGTIVGGTVNDTGSGLQFQGGTLDGVSYQGTLDLSPAGSSVTITDGLTATNVEGTGPGSIQLTGSDSGVSFDGTQTFDDATVDIGSGGAPDQPNGITPAPAGLPQGLSGGAELVNEDSDGTGAILTLGSSLTITQTGALANLTGGDNSGDGVVNDGLIESDAPGASFAIALESFTNNGTIDAGAQGGQFLIAAATFINNGKIDVVNGDSLDVAGDVTGSGTMTIGAATLELGGAATQAIAFTDPAGLLQLEQPASFAGTIAGLAIGDVIDLANTIVASTSINGSTLTVKENGGQVLKYQIAGALSGDFFAIQSDGSGGSDLILTQNTGWKGPSSKNRSGTWNTAANWSLGTVPGAADTALISASGSYTITSAQSNTVANLKLTDAAATLALSGGTFAVLDMSRTAGSIAVGDGATLQLTGTMTDTGTIGLDAAAGAADLVVAGSVTLTGAGALVMTDAGGNEILGNGAAATLDNGLTISGAGTIGDSDLTLVNKAAGVIDASAAAHALTIATGANTVKNSGLLEATGSGGLVVSGALANNGSLAASGGTVTVLGAVTGTGQATIAGATLEFGARVAAGQTVTFASGASGLLELGLAQSFTGTVAGLAAGDAIDLANFAFAKKATIGAITGTGAAGSDTDVTVKDGSLTATIALFNQYANEYSTSASAYTLASDEIGTKPGTLLELAPAHV